MTFGLRLSLRAALLVAACGLVVGCQGIRNAAGLNKEAPDEFAVVTKQPLVMPPDYNLRPPREGAPPTNQADPASNAQSALFDTDPSAAAKNVKGDFSQAEKLLLAQTGAVNTDPSIRQEVASDGRAMEAADDSFTEKLLFWKSKKIPGTPVDAEAEDKRLSAERAAGDIDAPHDSATIQRSDDDNAKSEHHGWLDGIF
ncbi:MAG: DUF3035 domain-containing protein [Alphaproteobacteria bacterium]|nr:DUF3035 domain-containing protein [Alphaproteobacteria bacterium]MBV9695024.1 DUF3035 domain-containing protein [Alphaproteobacteria bacterium]